MRLAARYAIAIYVRMLSLSIAVCVVAALGYWAALKAQVLAGPPDLLAALVGLALTLLLVVAGILGSELVRLREGRGRRGAALMVVLGIVSCFSGGLANWLFRLQGYVVLVEGDAIPLVGDKHLLEFSAGPLADLRELPPILELVEVELARLPDGRLTARSRLRVTLPDGRIEAAEIQPRQSWPVGPLRIFSGAFGYAPRIVITDRADRILHDEPVHFITRRSGAGGTHFAGRFEVAEARLRIRGVVNLDPLDSRLRGHPELELVVHRGDTLLGQGRLRLGRLAEIGDRYRARFVDLRKWVEVDFARRSYPLWIKLGMALFLLGACLWPVAHWKKW